jgi:hypothetical protein
MRLLFYFAMFGMLDDDEETQKRGTVFIYYGIGQEKFFGSDRPIQYVKTERSIPFRVVALHVCSDSTNPGIKAASDFACRAMDNTIVSRYRLHVGKFVYRLSLLRQWRGDWDRVSYDHLDIGPSPYSICVG